MQAFKFVIGTARALGTLVLCLLLCLPASAGTYDIDEEDGHGTLTWTPPQGSPTSEGASSSLSKENFCGTLSYEWEQTYHYSWVPSSDTNDEPVASTITAAASGEVSLSQASAEPPALAPEAKFTLSCGSGSVTHIATNTSGNGSLNLELNVVLAGQWDGEFKVTTKLLLTTTDDFLGTFVFAQNIPLPYIGGQVLYITRPSQTDEPKTNQDVLVAGVWKISRVKHLGRTALFRIRIDDPDVLEEDSLIPLGIWVCNIANTNRSRSWDRTFSNFAWGAHTLEAQLLYDLGDEGGLRFDGFPVAVAFSVLDP